MIAHRALHLELTPFLATSAVVGAVVGLALQDTLGNLFAGIALHSEAPFRVGEWVRLGDSEGRVEQVSWRAMRLRTWYGDTLTIPNNEAARQAILNFTAPAEPHARMLRIGVNYHTPPNEVITVLGKLLEQVPVDRGEVEVRKTMGGGTRPLARLMEGQFFGEMALLTGESRAATVVAATDVDVFTIGKLGFHDVLVANPAIAVDISAILAGRREALSQAEGDLAGRFGGPRSPGELKQRILDRIRSYFGL
jgi:small-conductance mechanosensitive channel